MPYIKPHRRDDLSTWDNPRTVGELNYAFTKVLNTYLNRFGLDYQAINDIVGALESCKMEFYRRVAVPYEGHTMEHNGDVYSKDVIL